ncbi:MAG: hydrolase [Myxococcales bacterium]|nr:hydrolase [Myxococcales bacterium]|tara:strand:- start:695 stop:1276 length:582 start_codon:yes stop_codon:yes gene_type:complete
MGAELPVRLPSRLHQDTSVLVIVDVQERLMGAMKGSIVEQTVKNTSLLVRAAKRLNIPILVTEQYPKGLGSTLEPIVADVGEPWEPIEKLAFSCLDAPVFAERFKALQRNQVVLCGAEAHVCVLQTALQALEEGHEVAVVSDAIASRSKTNFRLAQDDLRAAGSRVLPVESVLFEWLRRAEGDAFKEISRSIR